MTILTPIFVDLFAFRFPIDSFILVVCDLEGALAAYDESLGIARKLADDKGKGNAEAQRDLLISLQNVGNTQLQMAEWAGALASYEEMLSIARVLAKDKDNAEAQRDLSVSLNKVGNAKKQGGDLEGALAAYDESLGIARKLADDKGKGDAEAQRDLLISLEGVGDALKALGRLQDALPYDEEDLAISQTLATQSEGDERRQSDLAAALTRVGTDLHNLKRLNEAFADYEKALAIRQRLAATHPNETSAHDNLKDASEDMGELAYSFLLVREVDKSLAASDRAIAASPDLLWLQINRAHALMFLGRIEKAQAIYLAHRGQKLYPNEDDLWEKAVLDDFAELRKAGLSNPLMAKIEKTFAGHAGP